MNARIRARVIQEWRGLPEPPPRPDRTVSVAAALGKVMQSLGLGERFRQEEMIAAWQEIVGEFIASHAQPVSLQKGVLIVQVLQSTMHYELDRVWKRTILAKLKERFGPRSVREIKFRIG